MLLKKLLFTLLIVQSVFAAEKADFFITPDPLQFAFLDRYQQNMSDVDKAALPRNTPWRIVQRDLTLADGFTRVMRLRWQNRDFFLKLDSDGALPAGGILVEEQAMLNDTLSVSSGGDFFLAADGEQRRLLPAGTAVVRLWKEKGYWFARRLDSGDYGWLSAGTAFGEPAAKKTAALPVSDTVEDSLLFNQIREAIDQANDAYGRFVDNFNQRFRQDRSAPQWSVTDSDGRIDIALQPAAYTEQLGASTRQLILSIETLLIGRPWYVYSEQNRIVVAREEL